MTIAKPSEKIVWSQPQDMPGIEILSVENCQRLWHVFHQTYTICTVIEHGGLTDWRYRGKRHVLYNRHVMLMEPGEFHRNIRHTAIGSFHVLQIHPTLVETMAREAGLGSAPHFKLAQTSSPAIFKSFAIFHSAQSSNSSLLERESRLTAALSGLLERCSEGGLRPGASHTRAALLLARDCLHEHCAANISLEWLARIAGLSRFHFLRLFAQQFGLPPHSYQIALRVERTRKLLKAGVPIGEIEVGFTDQSHLNRHFKRSTGVTPGQYAMMMGKRTVP